MVDPTEGIAVKIDAVLSDVIAEVDNEMLTEWVLIAKTIGQDGSPAYQILSTPSMTHWDVGGILLYAGKHFNENNRD
jgi:hypothetical protein